jgi:hypothetical protein
VDRIVIPNLDPIQSMNGELDPGRQSDRSCAKVGEEKADA